ncbi:MAG TPA: hypothetical protein VFH68_14725 [Polyangia bacterium]|jgi:hypothetical protein|nr:hypothetical protein [Polyangia bacterium]
MIWAPFVGVLAMAGGLQVDSSTPDALCPDIGQVRAAAQARLGDIEAEGAWHASYALIHRPDRVQAGDVVRLQLHDPIGRLRLQRDLPRAGESCVALARALVVVLESYFRHPSDDPPAPAPDRARPARVVVSARAQPAPSAARLALDLGGGWAGGWSGAEESSPVLAIDVRLRIAPPAWWAGLEGAWLVTQQTQPVSGSSLRASERSFAVRAFVARDLLGGAGRSVLLVGPEAVLALDRADSTMLMDGGARMRASFGAGLRAHFQLALAREVFLGLLAAVDYLPRPWGGSFWVDDPPTGTTTEIFPASRVRLMIGVGLSWAVF